MRHPFIAGNWKMHKTVHEAVVYVKEFRSLVKDVEDVEIVVAPTFTAIHAAAEAARNSKVGIAGQDLHWEKQGAFTGEVAIDMLKDLKPIVNMASTSQMLVVHPSVPANSLAEFIALAKKQPVRPRQ